MPPASAAPPAGAAEGGVAAVSYSEEEKAFHLQRMWAEGLTCGGAWRLYGGPNRETLRKWERAWERGEIECARPRVPGACAHEKHARYPEGTRREALRLLAQGKPAREVARMLGLRPGTPGAWRRAEARAKMPTPGAEGAPRAGGGRVGAAQDRVAELEARVAALEGELAELGAQNEALRAVVGDPKAGGPASLSPRLKVELGERLRRERGWPLPRILTFFSISRSTYYYNRRRAREAPGTAGGEVDALVRASFEASGGTYGYRRAAADTGLPQRRVRGSMKRQGLRARDSRACKGWSSYAGEVSPAPAPNLLLGERGHDFSAQAPNERWAADITQMGFAGGKLWWSVVVDLFDGRLVAARWSLSPDAGLANATLRDALASLPEGAAGPLLHSDRGCHYQWPGWIALCDAAGVARSMSRKAHSPDNAACEALFGRMKVEMYRGREWRSAEELGAALDGYGRWYNSERLKSWPEEGRRGRPSYETIDGRRRRLGLPA